MSTRNSGLVRARIIGLLFALAGAAYGAGWATGQGSESPDPVPVRRIVVSPERLPAELAKAKQGLMTPISQAELNAKLAQAARAQAAAKIRPHLVQASYVAELAGANLSSGTGTWTLQNDSAMPDVLALPGFNLALSKCKTASGGDAVLGELDGKNLGLLVDKEGDHAYFFDWSARGAWKAAGLTFDLRLPPCPRTVLELKLPADHALSVANSAVLVTGPHEAESSTKRIWRIQAAGVSALEIVVRKLLPVDAGAAILAAQLQSTYKIQPGNLAADFDFQIEVLHAAVKELVLDCPAELQPHEVSLRGADLLSWKHHPADKVGSNGVLTVQLRQPLQGLLSSLRVRCLATLPRAAPWTAPTLLLRNVTTRSEHVTLQLHPDLQWQHWSAGAFREVSSTQTRDGGHTVTLVRERPDAARPTGLLSTGIAHLSARLQTWWKLHPTAPRVRCDLACNLSQGHLFQLTVRIPAGWTAESVTAEPKELLASWTAADELLRLELAHGLKPGMPGKFSIHLRPTSGVAKSELIDIPELDPLEATVKEGLITVTADAAAKVALVNLKTPLISPAKNGPWSPAVPLLAVPWRGQPPKGQIRWSPGPSFFNAQIQQDVIVHDKDMRLDTRLALEPVEGLVESIDIHCAEPFRPVWRHDTKLLAIQTERLHQLEALSVLLHLGDRHALQAASLQAALPEGERWRLTFSPPLSKSTTLQWSTLAAPRGASFDAATPVQALMLPCQILLPPTTWAASLFAFQQHKQTQCWSLPLITIIGSQRIQGSVRVQASGLQTRVAQQIGLDRDGPPSGNVHARSVEAWSAQPRAWRYAAPSALPSLVLQSSSVHDEAQRGPLVQHPWLMTSVDVSGPLVHRFGIDLWHWSRPTLPIGLPADTTQVLGIRVDDKWLDRLELQTTALGKRLDVPITAGPQGCRLEVIYTTAGAGGTDSWTRVCAAPIPDLPFPLRGCKRLWRVAAGLRPLHEEEMQLRNLPGSHGDAAPLLDQVKRSWHAPDQLLDGFLPLVTDAAATRRQQVVLGTETSWRQHVGGVELSLGEALDQLLFDYWKDQTFLVVDRSALAQAGLHAKTSLGMLSSASTGPFWESLGLVYLSLPAGGLLTSQQQLLAWTKQFDEASLRAALNQAVADAAVFGHDRSARVQSLATWLRAADGSHKEIGWSCPDKLDEGAEEGWTVWQPLAGTTDAEPLMLVRQDRLRAFCQILALVLVLAAWRLGRAFSGRWRFRLWLILMTACVFGLLRLPPSLMDLAWWPALSGGLIALFWTVPGWFRPAPAAIHHTSSAQTTIALAMVGVLAVLVFFCFKPAKSWSGGPEPFTVLLLPATETEPPMALVPPELLQQLEQRIKRVSPASRPIVLVSGSYTVRAQDGKVELEARYEMYSFADKADLIVPLSGVDLKEGAFLDGAPAFPAVNQDRAGGYRLSVQGKGWHRLNLVMTARPQRLGPFHELVIGIPVMALAQVEVQAPTTWRSLHVVEGQGEDKVHMDSGKQNQTLRAQLGPAGRLHLRWFPAALSVADPIEVQEAYFWDLRPEQLTLSAGLQYDSPKNPLSQVIVDVPAQALVRGVEATLPGKVSALKSWQVHNQAGLQRLVIDLSQPVVGKLNVHVTLLMKQAPGGGAYPLALPQPVNVKTGEGLLAYRLEGVRGTEQAQNLAVTNVDPGTFSRFWTSLGRREPGPIQRAFGFRRTSPGAALHLTVQRWQPTVEADLRWNLTAPFAEWTGTLTLQGGGAPLAFLEWQLPADVAVTEILGPNLHQWSRQGATIQMWFREPQPQTVLQLKGYRPLPFSGKKESRFQLPALHFPGANVQNITWTLRAATPLEVEEQHVAGLTRVPSGKETQALIYQARGEKYDGVFLLRTQSAPPKVQGSYKATLLDGACQITAQARWPQGTAGLPVRLRLDHLPGDQVRLDVSDPAWRVTYQRKDQAHEWLLSPPPAAIGPLFVNCSAQVAAPANQSLSLPELRCLDAEWQDFTVVVTGQPYKVGIAEKLQLLPPPAKDAVMGGMDAKTTVKTWKASAPGWKLAVTPLPTPVVPSVVIVYQDQRSIWEDASVWGNLALIDLFVRQPGDLNFRLPLGAELIGTAVDDAWTTVRSEEGGRFTLALQGPPGPRRLQLRWRYPTGSAAPNLAGPVFTDLPMTGWQGQLIVPPGLDWHSSASLPTSAENRLRLAQAQVKMSALLAEDIYKEKTSAAPAQLLNCQKRFYALKRQADVDKSAGDSGPANLDHRWRQLREENQQLAKTFGFEALRIQAEKQPWPATDKMHPALAASVIGLPVAWAVVEGEPLPSIAVAFTSQTSRETSRWIAELVVVGGLAVFLLSFVPGPLVSLRLWWPELVLLISALGMLTLGLSLVGVLLIGVALLTRLVWLVHRTLAVVKRVVAS